jgi:transposase
MDKNTTYLGQPILQQVLSLIPESIVHKAAIKHKANYHSKQLLFKDHLVTMLYCIFSRCTSLREVQTGLELCNGKLNHLGLSKVPARSTLSDGNKKRNSDVFGEVYSMLYDKYRHIISDSPLKHSIASKLYILDSSTISLFKAILKPAGRKRLDGKSKGGIKVHTLLKADCNMPCIVKYTAAALHDQQFYQYINELPSGSIIAFDKAYINYQQFAQFADRSITYVVPQKDNAVYASLTEIALKDDEPQILKDERIQVSYHQTIENASIERTLQIRRIAYYSPQHKTVFVYQTNNTELAAMDIVAIYQNRWQIEKFFKKLKQNFPLHYFLGDNENAIQIQIWCALIGLLLLQVIFTEQKVTLAFSILASMVSLHIMNYISLSAIINAYKQKRVRNKKKRKLKGKSKNTTPYFVPTFNF